MSPAPDPVRADRVRVLGTACSLCQRPSRSRDGMRRVLAPPSRRRRAGGGRPSPRIWTRPHAPSGRVSGRHFVNRPCSAGGPLEPQHQVCGNPTSATFRMFGAGTISDVWEPVGIYAVRLLVRITRPLRKGVTSGFSDLTRALRVSPPPATLVRYHNRTLGAGASPWCASGGRQRQAPGREIGTTQSSSAPTR